MVSLVALIKCSKIPALTLRQPQSVVNVDMVLMPMLYRNATCKNSEAMQEPEVPSDQKMWTTTVASMGA